MGLRDKLARGILKEGTGLVQEVGNAIDKIGTSKEELAEKKNEITSMILNALEKIHDLQAGIVLKEMSGNWLQRSWRPIVMLTFTAMLVATWLGFASPKIPEDLHTELIGLIKIGMGGFIIGRSVEKVTGKLTDNIDIPFLKKKDRKGLFNRKEE